MHASKVTATNTELVGRQQHHSSSHPRQSITVARRWRKAMGPSWVARLPKGWTVLEQPLFSDPFPNLLERFEGGR